SGTRSRGPVPSRQRRAEGSVFQDEAYLTTQSLLHALASAGNDDRTAAELLETLVRVYASAGDVAREAWAARRLLAVQERLLGPQNPALASFLQLLAGAEEELGNSAEAEALLSRALPAAT